jgi:hypothetical protein
MCTSPVSNISHMSSLSTAPLSVSQSSDAENVVFEEISVDSHLPPSVVSVGDHDRSDTTGNNQSSSACSSSAVQLPENLNRSSSKHCGSALVSSHTSSSSNVGDDSPVAGPGTSRSPGDQDQPVASAGSAVVPVNTTPPVVSHSVLNSLPVCLLVLIASFGHKKCFVFFWQTCP